MKINHLRDRGEALAVLAGAHTHPENCGVLGFVRSIYVRKGR